MSQCGLSSGKCKFHQGENDAWITSLPIIFQDSDGEKSDDLVVDVSNEVSADSSVRGSMAR